jgi:hypothetical protein
MNKIFVQIASYRDTELLPTLRDICSKSSGENELSFGIVWQKDDSESISEFESDSRVRIIDCKWQDSKGLGWARSLTQSLYKDEDFTLQLDSHHRFCKDWDKILINIYNDLKLQSDKPLITSYAASYDPNNDKNLEPKVCKVLPHDFKSSGTIWFNPVGVKESIDKPIFARFVSGHYFFTTGYHCNEYKYDPDLYFAGDEIALSVRSYTMGYDLYHPHKCVVWHHYGRNDRIKHWGDHNVSNKDNGTIEKTWMERDTYSKQRIRQLLGEEDSGIDLGIYGLGNKRTLQDYERYCGFDFKNRRIQKSAIDGIDPPLIFNNEQDWNRGFKKSTLVNISFNCTEILENLNSLVIFKLELISLDKKVIYTENISKNSILKDYTLPIKKIIISDHVPMKCILYGLNQDLQIIIKNEKDLKPGIHWN